MTNKLLFVFVYLLSAATTSSTFTLMIGYTRYVFERNVADVISSLK